jgi:molybdate transport system substrate-binding protein
VPLLRVLAAGLALFVLMPTVSARAQDAVRLYAAGSLRLALTEVGDAFHTETGVAVAGIYGASGLLRQR